jgi:ABC-2 type transport system permease protein
VSGQRPAPAARPLDLRSAPGAAPALRRVLAQARLELLMTVRNGEQVLLTLVIPLGLLVGLAATSFVRLGPASTAGRVGAVLPGVLTLAVLSTAFTGLAIQTGFERRYGVLKRLGATPLSRRLLLAGKAGAVGVVELVQVVLLLGVAVALGWRPGPVDPLAVLAFLLLGTACLASLGLLLAGVLRAEATLAAANAVYLVLLLAGGIAVPLDRMPQAARPWLELLPSGALARGLTDALDGSGVALGAAAVLLGWTAVAAFLVSRTFRWQ